MSFEEWYDQHFGSADPNVVQAGNIDLGDRPPVYNEDGTVSTEKSFSIQDDPYGREVLLPQVVGGKMLSQKDAIQHYRDTGEHLGIYKDIPTADAYATSIHERIPRLDTPDVFPVGQAMQSIRDLPGWAAYRMYRGATRSDLPGEGMSAREEAALPGPPLPQDWSFSRAVQHFSDQIPDLYNQLKQNVLPQGFSVQRGIDSALAPAKWLFNEARQGVLSDDDIQEIKRNPYSVRSIEAMTQAAISLSRGAGGEEGLPRGAVPKNIWESWKPLPDYKGEGGQIRVDPAGNHYQLEGSHETADGGLHAIVKPIEPPLTYAQQHDQDVANLKKSILEQNRPKDPEELSIHDPNSPHYDKGFTDWFKKVYPEDFDAAGNFTAHEDLKKWQDQQATPKPEPGSIMDEWSKKHAGQVPDFGSGPTGQQGGIAGGPEPMPPDKPPGYWGNANDRKYSGPLTGQQWADIYATPDVDFTAGPTNIENFKSFLGKLPIKEDTGPPDAPLPEWAKDWTGADQPFESKLRSLADWFESLKAGDITLEQYKAASAAIRRGENPPLPPPPNVDPGIVEDFNNISKWQEKQRKENYQMNRWNWKPGDDNL